ncbi:MAG: hypothetical protein K2M04_03435 [Muribaculaceae bacterium]|nr:hypothetical protein [Muribaculaceae bacterium]
MQKLILLLIPAITVSNAVIAGTLPESQRGGEIIVETTAYKWQGDSIIQGKAVAYAPNDSTILSSYHAQPGYFMPIEQEWVLKNDISSYPRLESGNRLHNAVYRMGLDEMVNAVEPDTTLRTGKEWSGVWTRDVSYSIILSMAHLQPEASMISLRHKVDPLGRIIQDTGSGGAWPVSSDRMIWAVAAWEVYKVTGNREWLEWAYPIVERSLAADRSTITDPESGLKRGETSFIDWREQSYPRWMQSADIYSSEAMGTNVVHVAALNAASAMARELGHKNQAKEYAEEAKALAKAVNEKFWMDDKGYYGMYTYGTEFPILNPRAETLGESLAILFDVADEERAKTITKNNPTTPYGAAIFFPQISDMPAYHNNALWPFVASYWALANAKAGNEQGAMEAIGSVVRPAALFATNKENFNLDNGDIATELNSSNMLWSLAGNIALTNRILFGMNFDRPDRLDFRPFVPKQLEGTRQLRGVKYRDADIDITVTGSGDSIAQFTLNGKNHAPYIPADFKGKANVSITMAHSGSTFSDVNHTANVKAPLTPIARLNGKRLEWNPIEYIAGYKVLRDGKTVATTRSTTFDASIPGVYQVIGFDSNGTESFASQPLSTREQVIIEIPGESNTLTSAEVAYTPEKEITGFSGNGFVETDHVSAPISVTFDASEAGEYLIALRYANGNGPVNTENRCAVRTLSVNGKKADTVVMPHRGVANWDDWGMSNAVKTILEKGKNTITIDFNPITDENMNIHTNHAIIDCVTIEKI